MIKDRKISIIYKSLILVSAILGILLQCEIGTSNFSLSSFRMFTTLSNLAVAIFYFIYVVSEIKKPNSATNSIKFKYFKFLITMSITLTGLVAHFMLKGLFDDMDNIIKAGLVLLHYVVPIATFLDWLLFDIKGQTTKLMPLFSAIFPIVYVIVSLISAQFISGEGKYPYPFLNIDTLGVKAVLINIVLLSIAYFAVGYLGVFMDHKLNNHS